MYWIYYNHSPVRCFDTEIEAVNFIAKLIDDWKCLGLPGDRLEAVRSGYTLDYMGNPIDWRKRLYEIVGTVRPITL